MSEEQPAQAGHNGFAAAQLRSVIERIERLEEEKSALATDISQVYSEAKGNGFDVKIVRQLVRDLDFRVKVEASPTFREASGLAMSSRNQLLSPANRELAPAIYQVLQTTRAKYRRGEWDVAAWENEARSHLESLGFRVDYCELRDRTNLQPATAATQPVRMFMAAYLGPTRLIDNLEFDR